jgi:RHS repeat-associated protein
MVVVTGALWSALPEARADVLQHFNYSYDDANNVIGITDNVTPANTQTLTYDNQDRLDSATGSYGFYDYAYDAIGNMTVNPQLGASNQAYAYRTDGIRPHAVCITGAIGVTCPATSQPYQYDANGNLTSGSGRVYDWSEENKPTCIATAAGTCGAALGKTTFVYDGRGSRLKKIAGPTTTLYVSKLYECDNGSCSRYIWVGKKRIAVIPDSPTAQICNATQSPGGACYYHTDHLGSSSTITDPSGTLIESVSYYPYGEVRTDSPGTPVSVPYKYTGKEKDTSTGLYYYEARYYDPVLARFISADTIVPSAKESRDFNRYTYVRNNPFLYTDPSGNFIEAFIGLFGFGGNTIVDLALEAAKRAAEEEIRRAIQKARNGQTYSFNLHRAFLTFERAFFLGDAGLAIDHLTGRNVEKFQETRIAGYLRAGYLITGAAVATFVCVPCSAGIAKGALVGTVGGLAKSVIADEDPSRAVLMGGALGAIGGGIGGDLIGPGLETAFTTPLKIVGFTAGTAGKGSAFLGSLIGNTTGGSLSGGLEAVIKGKDIEAGFQLGAFTGAVGTGLQVPGGILNLGSHLKLSSELIVDLGNDLGAPYLFSEIGGDN